MLISNVYYCQPNFKRPISMLLYIMIAKLIDFFLTLNVNFLSKYS